jgi:hypothetical protein
MPPADLPAGSISIGGGVKIRSPPPEGSVTIGGAVLWTAQLAGTCSQHGRMHGGDDDDIGDRSTAPQAR